MGDDGQSRVAWRLDEAYLGPVVDVVAAPRSRVGIDARTSKSIAAARVICILGIVYVHAWTGLTGPELAASGGSAQGLLRWALSELFGRSAVPLLGMVSGWLVVEAVRKRGWSAFIAAKAKTVLLPMVLWNAIAIVLVGGAAEAGWLSGPRPTSWPWVVNELFCLAQPADINVQMSFLRDLFVCMLLAPMLVRLEQGALLTICAGAAAWTVFGPTFPLLLRPAILSFFILGMLARRGDWPARIASRPLAVVGAPYLLLALAKVWLETRTWSGDAAWAPFMAGFDLVMRFSAAIAVWSVAWRLASGPLAPRLLRIEPFMFLMFCAHLVILWLVGPIVGLATGPMGSPLYPVFLVLQPLLVLLAAIGLGRGLSRLAPDAASVLSGGRLRPTLRDESAGHLSKRKARAAGPAPPINP